MLLTHVLQLSDFSVGSTEVNSRFPKPVKPSTTLPIQPARAPYRKDRPPACDDNVDKLYGRAAPDRLVGFASPGPCGRGAVARVNQSGAQDTIEAEHRWGLGLKQRNTSRTTALGERSPWIA